MKFCDGAKSKAVKSASISPLSDETNKKRAEKQI